MAAGSSGAWRGPAGDLLVEAARPRCSPRQLRRWPGRSRSSTPAALTVGLVGLEVDAGVISPAQGHPLENVESGSALSVLAHGPALALALRALARQGGLGGAIILQARDAAGTWGRRVGGEPREVSASGQGCRACSCSAQARAFAQRAGGHHWPAGILTAVAGISLSVDAATVGVLGESALGHGDGDRLRPDNGGHGVALALVPIAEATQGSTGSAVVALGAAEALLLCGGRRAEALPAGGARNVAGTALRANDEGEVVGCCGGIVLSGSWCRCNGTRSREVPPAAELNTTAAA